MDLSMREILDPYLRRHVGRILDLDAGIRAADPRAIHRTRTSCTRVRSLLRAYEDCFEPLLADRIRTELRWLAQALGAQRDLDVEAATIAAVLHDPGLEERIRSAATIERAVCAARLQVVVGSPRYAALRDELEAFGRSPGWTMAADASAATASGVVRAQVEQIAERTARAFGTPSEPRRDRRLHRARAAVKQARYAAEAAGSAGSYGHLMSHLRRAQRDVGQHHDLVVALEHAGRLRRHVPELRGRQLRRNLRIAKRDQENVAFASLARISDAAQG